MLFVLMVDMGAVCVRERAPGPIWAISIARTDMETRGRGGGEVQQQKRWALQSLDGGHDFVVQLELSSSWIVGVVVVCGFFGGEGRGEGKGGGERLFKRRRRRRR